MIREGSRYRLLVEGRDDQHSVIHLTGRHGINWDDAATILPCVYDCGGFEPLLASLGVNAKSYERLGVVVDANTDLEKRWAQVKTALKRAEVVLPESPEAGGVTVAGMYPDWKVGVWLMPDNRNRGQLEDFLSELIQAGDARWDYACEATQHAKEIGAAFPEREFCKARIHTWLAWQERPGLPFGTAITAKYFGVDSPQARDFVQWFGTLFL